MDTSEQEIVNWVKQTERDLRTAREFLDMWHRRNAANKPPTMEPPQAVQAPLLSESRGEENGADYGATKRALLAAIAKCPEQYTVYDVEKASAEAGALLTKAQIQQGLSRLAKHKQINIVKKGAGRQPAIYRK